MLRIYIKKCDGDFKSLTLDPERDFIDPEKNISVFRMTEVGRFFCCRDSHWVNRLQCKPMEFSLIQFEPKSELEEMPIDVPGSDY